MTGLTIQRISAIGSIESVTGWTGAHSDEPPSTAPATIPGTKLQNGQRARGFNPFEGAAMSRVSRKSSDSLRFAVSPDLSIKADNQGKIVGYASTFGGEPDHHFDVVQAGAFAKSIEAHRSAGTAPIMFWSHKADEVIGRWTAIEEDRHGLLVEGRLNLRTTRGKDAYEHLLSGDTGGLSIGFRIPEGGSEFQRTGITLLKTIDLVEISVVAIPANPRARVQQVKSLGSKAELVDLLRSTGLPKTAAARIAAGGWPALSGDDQQKAIDLALQIEQATAQLKEI